MIMHPGLLHALSILLIKINKICLVLAEGVCMFVYRLDL